VRATLIVHNAAGAPLTLYLGGRPVAVDLVVRRRDGTPVWRRLRGAVIPAILQVRELGPGGQLTFELAWDQTTDAGGPAGVGEYELQGFVMTDAREPLATAPLPLRIVPRA
jgi:hypothetical protein